MPRRKRFCPAGLPVHVIQRGNNRQLCFTSDSDFAAYANWLYEGANKFRVDINAWVFMANHVHLLLTPSSDNSISKLMQFIGRLYVRYFNYRYARSGTLFEGRFRASLIQEDEFFLTCMRYIELNPVRAGMVNDPAEYKWSSFRAHGLGKNIRMWSPHPIYLALGQDSDSRSKRYRELTKTPVNTDVVAKIRHCANSGLVLGTEKFRQQFRNITGDSH